MIFYQAAIASEIGNLTGTFFSGALMAGLVIIVIGIVAGVFGYIAYRRKFGITVEIRSVRSGGGYVTFFDRAAILKERKTKRPFLRLLKEKAELPAPSHDLFETSEKGNLLRIRKLSDEVYKYLKPDRIGVNHDQFTEADSQVLNWLAKNKLQTRKLFDAESMVMKILPYIPLIAGGMFMIFMLWIVLDKLPALISSLRSLSEELGTIYGASVTEWILPLIST